VLEGEIDGEVGKARGVVHVEQTLGDASQTSAFQDSPDGGLVLDYELFELTVDDVDLGVFLDLHPESPRLVDRSGPYPCPGQPGHDDVAVVIGLLDVSDGPDSGVSALDTRDEEKAAV